MLYKAFQGVYVDTACTVSNGVTEYLKRAIPYITNYASQPKRSAVCLPDITDDGGVMNDAQLTDDRANSLYSSVHPYPIPPTLGNCMQE